MDPIADMLIIIKNGYMAKKPQVSAPFSRVKFEIAKIMEKENFVGSVTKEDAKINIKLVYVMNVGKITEIKRISKLGLRVYTKAKNIKKVKAGRGITIVSTPSGVMTGYDAKKKNLGGEIICQIS